MKKCALSIIVVTGLLLSVSLKADVLVLVHGWAANADSWIHSGVVQVLSRNGWSNAGMLTLRPGIGVWPSAAEFEAADPQVNKRVYRVNLPAEAPLQIQAAYLYSHLSYIRQQHSGDRIILAGHSAGGVVSRLTVVNGKFPEIDTLITIASPNSGTVRAIQGLDVIYDKPFFCPGPGIGFVKDVVGGVNYQYLEYSQGALIDLQPAVPGSLLGWLNQQPHPAIHYHSIVRSMGDELVPAASQDLNQVAGLKGKSRLYLSPASHSLNPADGQLIADILR